ncbi:DUF948 domain-containing protein [Oryzomonas japonica]|uniref:DUF948 domain-containing protein n=1 Tax=Oryzomonas japonica TaxID=2603858 RepID=A0A7J4ZR09_9BACT|nr:DUF948 domain-containing protein [Oryzomonas japonica]KAB0665436.1 DUF948 domain-containing protein [Oryzomonas japonica]
MTLTGIVLIIISAALCIMVLAFIPTLLAVKRAAISLGALSEMVHTELKPALQELTAALTELRAVGGDVAEHADDVKRFMTALGETGDNLNTINRSVGMVAGVLSATSTWAIGAKVAGKYLLERYLKKRGGK